jgi:hypothetical protein
MSSSESRSSKFRTGCAGQSQSCITWRAYGMKMQVRAWDRIAATYRTWRRGRYRRLIGGFIKRSLFLLLALLKPIVKVPEIFLAFLALLEFIEFAKAVVPVWKVVQGIVGLFLYFIGIECGPVYGFGMGERPKRGSWRPFFRQWYAGGTKKCPTYLRVRAAGAAEP